MHWTPKRNVTMSAWCNSRSRGCCKNRQSCCRSRAHRRSRISRKTWQRRNSSSVRRSGRGSKIWRGRVEDSFELATPNPFDQNLIACQFSVVRGRLFANCFRLRSAENFLKSRTTVSRSWLRDCGRRHLAPSISGRMQRSAGHPCNSE